MFIQCKLNVKSCLTPVHHVLINSIVTELPVFETLTCPTAGACTVHVGEPNCSFCGEEFPPYAPRRGTLLSASRPSVVYLPIRDRLQRLLNSDLRALFDYADTRSGGNLRTNGDLLSDVFDGSAYKDIMRMVPIGSTLIPLVFSSDGYNMFDTNQKSLWPLSYFILSLPPKLRHLMHIGKQHDNWLLYTCKQPVDYMIPACIITVHYL